MFQVKIRPILERMAQMVLNGQSVGDSCYIIKSTNLGHKHSAHVTLNVYKFGLLKSSPNVKKSPNLVTLINGNFVKMSTNFSHLISVN